MTEAHLDYESPYKSGGYSSSKEQRMNDLYYSESGKKHGYMDSGSKYDALKSSEREISGHLDRANQYQEQRLHDEMNANQFYKRELENIRSELNKKRNKVQSNHFSTDEDYLLQSTKDRIKNLQYLREKELSDRFESPKAENAAFSSAGKSNQKYKLHDEDWQNRTDEKFKASHLTESVGTNKTYDLSQSLRGSSNEYREKVAGGLKSLEDKMNLMEKELDEHLTNRNKEYFTNKELVKQRQRQREQEMRNRDFENAEEDDEEEARMESMQKKENKASTEQFKSVFDKREERLEHDQQEIERETARKHEEEEEAIQEENSSEVEGNGDQVDVENNRAFEQELEFLKEENQRIKNELLSIKDNYETQKRHGEVKLHAADILAQEHSRLSAKTSAAMKTSTRVIREPAKLKSNKTFAESKEKESITHTIQRAKKEVQTKLAENKLQRERSLNKKKNAAKEKSQKKPEFLGVRNELYQKYYGYPVHLKEASYFLSKGIPTTYMSDSRPEVAHDDAATTLPKRFAKAMKY